MMLQNSEFTTARVFTVDDDDTLPRNEKILNRMWRNLTMVHESQPDYLRPFEQSGKIHHIELCV
jgi:hypothetical protein